MRLRAMVVDDETLAREHVRDLLLREPDVDVVAECDGGRPAVDALRRIPVDVVFLDVQMPEVDGFEVLRQLEGEAMPHVVFVTAYDQYALQAFEANAMDYLLKPFRDERFAAAVARSREAVHRLRVGDIDDSLQALLDHVRADAPHHLVVRSPGRVRLVPWAEIDWVESAGNYVLVHTGGESHLMRETMAELETRLDPRQFLRTHRSAIVALDRIREVRLSSAGDGRVLLRDGAEIPLSRRYRKRFDAHLES